MEDAKALVSQLEERDSLLRLKRRWLMDLSLSEKELKRIKELLPPSDKFLPESFLREDDVNYECIKTCVEKGYGVDTGKTEYSGVLEGEQLFGSLDDVQDVFIILDEMTNIGLCSFVNILTGGLVKFEKTNLCMKMVVKDLLPKVFMEKDDISKSKLKQISQLLRDEKIFRGNQMVSSVPFNSYRKMGIKILEGLEDFPFGALEAMHRRVRAVKGYIPTLKPPKSGWTRDRLIKLLRKKCSKMLNGLNDGDKPSESLVGVLGVASTTLKLLLNHHVAVNFKNFAPEIEAMQNDIAKALWLLNDWKRISSVELKSINSILAPNEYLSARSLRSAVRHCLTEYLFECSEMETVPECLLETLAIINNKYQLPRLRKNAASGICSSVLMRNRIQMEIESILLVSAQAKELVLNLQTEHEFDQDFSLAYLKNFEDNDSSCRVFDDNSSFGYLPLPCESYWNDTYFGTEVTGETFPISICESNGFPPLTCEGSMLDSSSQPIHIKKMELDTSFDFFRSPECDKLKILDSGHVDEKRNPLERVIKTEMFDGDHLEKTAKQEFHSPSQSPKGESITNTGLDEQKIVCSQQIKMDNKYLEMQDACDFSSMFAYHYIGQMLEELAKREGVELYQGDLMYLQNGASVDEVFEVMRN